MITSVSELEKILKICGDVRAELKQEGIAYSETVELGIMIETPAAAVISDLLAPMVDFFSVGTNDLTQYTLACDRQNPQCRAVLRYAPRGNSAAHCNERKERPRQRRMDRHLRRAGSGHHADGDIPADGH